nr:immunoglobulin heavy chain junction region [Mus musculus]NSM07668.1 immunoglobulin heavy chain junction region [Mus musculus]
CARHEGELGFDYW